MPQYSGNANNWKVCSPSNTSGTNPPSTRWAYNEVTNPSTDAGHITACKNNNGGSPDVVYVTPNSGGTNQWSHSGITGVAKYFNECYNSGSVKNQWPACNGANGGFPMWNLAVARQNEIVGVNVYDLCEAVKSGAWIGFYSNGLTNSELGEFAANMNACTTGN